jgi:hypothetical protein
MFTLTKKYQLNWKSVLFFGTVIFASLPLHIIVLLTGLADKLKQLVVLLLCSWKSRCIRYTIRFCATVGKFIVNSKQVQATAENCWCVI